MSNTPICDAVSSTCRGCIADVECGTDICIESLGQCVGANNTLFVAPTGTNASSCPQTSPCATIDYALMYLANNRRTIAIADGTYGPIHIPGTLGANGLTISGPDLDPAGVVVSSPTCCAPALQVDNSSRDIIVEGVTFSGSQARGVDNRGTLTLSHVAIANNVQEGLSTNNSGTLRVRSCRIANNALGIDLNATTLELSRSVVTGNTGGGISIKSAGFTIENSIISSNGNTGSSISGVRFESTSGKTPQIFQFNTLAQNLGAGDTAVHCNDATALDSSILIGTTPIGPSCNATYSLFSDPPPAGGNNITGDPGLTTDFHITSTSAARGAGNPMALLPVDIDGEPRPQGIGPRDIGADEVP